MLLCLSGSFGALNVLNPCEYIPGIWCEAWMMKHSKYKFARGCLVGSEQTAAGRFHLHPQEEDFLPQIIFQDSSPSFHTLEISTSADNTLRRDLYVWIMVDVDEKQFC